MDNLRGVKVHQTCWVFPSFFLFHLAVHAQSGFEVDLFIHLLLRLARNRVWSWLTCSATASDWRRGCRVGNGSSQVLSPRRGLHNPGWSCGWAVPWWLRGEGPLDGGREWGVVRLLGARVNLIERLQVIEPESCVRSVGVGVLQPSGGMGRG